MPRPCRSTTNGVLWASAYPILGAAGFHYRGRAWHRWRAGLADVVIIQVSRHNTGSQCGFEVLVGLVVPEVYRLAITRVPTTRGMPDYHEAIVRFSAEDPRGSVDENSAWWFDAVDTADVVDTGVRLARTFREVVVPFFDRRASLQDVYALQEGPPSGLYIYWAYRAALDVLAGNREAAGRALQ